MLGYQVGYKYLAPPTNQVKTRKGLVKVTISVRQVVELTIRAAEDAKLVESEDNDSDEVDFSDFQWTDYGMVRGVKLG